MTDIAFKDELNGIAVAGWGHIIRTTDGGKTWTQEFAINHAETMSNNPKLAISYIGSKAIISMGGAYGLFWKEKEDVGIDEPTIKDLGYDINTNYYDNKLDIAIESQSNTTATLNIYDVSG